MLMPVLFALFNSPAVESIPIKDEMATALSAAPARLREGAGVLILGRSGFVRARPSRNGFNCLVERGRHSIAPVCYDAVGSRSTLQASLEEAHLASMGVSDAKIQILIDRDYRNGRLHAPDKPGVAYMLSEHFVRVDGRTGKLIQVYPPHVMFYAPYAHNSDLGIPAKDVRSRSHIWVEAEGRPDACIVVPEATVSR